MKHKLDSDKVLRLARKHLSSNSSARACMADAIAALNADKLEIAVAWALRSLAYSVGIFHPDYTSAFNASGVGGEVRLISVA